MQPLGHTPERNKTSSIRLALTFGNPLFTAGAFFQEKSLSRVGVEFGIRELDEEYESNTSSVDN
jgi:hypothetical protein